MKASENEYLSFIPNIDDFIPNGLAVYILSTPDKKYVVEQVDPEGVTLRRIEYSPKGNPMSLKEALVMVALLLEDDLEYN